jgi:uncharacterized membrane-anchored protein
VEGRSAMTQTSRAQESAPYPHDASRPSAWSGWIVFGAVMLMMLGAFQVIQGLVALFDDGFYLVHPSGLVVHASYNTWGWAHLIIGAVAIVSGLGLLVGNMAARVLGVIAAVVSAIVNLAFLSAYPVWSSIVIGLDVIVIYAIIVHGGELKEANR